MAEVATATGNVPITVVVGYQDPAILARCRALLADVEEIDIASAVEDGAEVIGAIKEAAPRVLLLDLDLASRSKVSLLPVLRRLSASTAVLLLTNSHPAEDIVPVLATGAKGHLDVRHVDRFLVTAVKALDAGEAWVPRRMVSALLAYLGSVGGAANSFLRG